ncbi:MAG: hypothetical protein ACLPWS_05270 [Rhodomicrobium sp.]
MIKFIYLVFGTKPTYQAELRYSISTLLAEMPEAAGNVTVYTDRPSLYIADNRYVKAVDIAPLLAEMTNGGEYVFRAKPWAVLHALRAHGCPCVFLDTDTFVKRGFARALKSQLQSGAVMDRYVRRHPFPECTGFETILPSGKPFRYDPKTAVMYNSGVIGVRPSDAAAIEDAIAIIDAIRPLSYKRTHDQEQFAINEALRIHGVRIGVIHNTLNHYCSRWQKRYMHWRFERIADIAAAPIVPRRPRIKVNKAIGAVFKYTNKRLAK